ncbi:YcbK family protein [Defluviimonas salinarum]|uniref:Murein endopeptidase K n=1 Tax=Defluviimonas salinarum TaxID=2992147 RepID=A0ABT3JAC3_9RHOB|nr:DUF882 domain-containing protein [Defluviimonas salinarum]MCW3784654.1 DUF882 domain-containing protein [Defluviimonas salinarum]
MTGIAATVAGPLMPAYAATTGIEAEAERPDRQGSRLDRLVPLIEPYLDLFNPHTQERLKVRFFGATGYNMSGIRDLNWLLRDWRRGEMVQLDVRLYWGLAAIRSASLKDGHSGEITVNSGFRTRQTNDKLRLEGYHTAPNSFHIKGRAVDFTVDGGKVEDVAKYAEWLEIGGTGHYRGRFVHIDSGRKRRWFG